MIRKKIGGNKNTKFCRCNYLNIHGTPKCYYLDLFSVFFLFRLVHHSGKGYDFQFFSVVAHNGRVITHVHVAHEHGSVIISQQDRFYASSGQDVPH